MSRSGVAYTIKRGRVLVERLTNRLMGRRTVGEINQGLIRLGVLRIGRETYGHPNIVLFGDPAELARNGTTISIGAFCSIAADVTIVQNGDHRTDWITTFPLRLRRGLPGAGHDGTPASRGAIVIGNDVWIARGSTILSGVTIGDGAVIGAGSVVTRDVAPYAVVSGNPAEVRKRRFDDEQIAALLRSRWWEWPDDVIDAHVDVLCSDRVADLIAIADARAIDESAKRERPRSLP